MQFLASRSVNGQQKSIQKKIGIIINIQLSPKNVSERMEEHIDCGGGGLVLISSPFDRILSSC